MTTTKEDRDKLDALVLSLVPTRAGITFASMAARVPAEHGHRDIDRSLQRLRKAGSIQFSKGAWRRT